MHKVFVRDIWAWGQGYPDVWVPNVPGISCPQTFVWAVFFSVLIIITGLRWPGNQQTSLNRVGSGSFGDVCCLHVIPEPRPQHRSCHDNKWFWNNNMKSAIALNKMVWERWVGNHEKNCTWWNEHQKNTIYLHHRRTVRSLNHWTKRWMILESGTLSKVVAGQLRTFTEPEPETGTVGTVFPGTASGTGTAGTTFQGPKVELELGPLLKKVETQRTPFPGGTVRTENRNRKNHPYTNRSWGFPKGGLLRSLFLAGAKMYHYQRYLRSGQGLYS